MSSDVDARASLMLTQITGQLEAMTAAMHELVQAVEELANHIQKREEADDA